MPTTTALVPKTNDFDLNEIEAPFWNSASCVLVDRYWDGSTAPLHRSFRAAALWSDKFLYIRFGARQGEPIVVADNPRVDGKTIGLWDRDVCELFLAPDRTEPRRYFEFEVAPTGEWVDLAIDLTSGTRFTDTNYASGMESFAEVCEGSVTIAMKIPWEAFGKRPNPGDAWLGNLLRCVGRDPNRGYLAWSPTMTAAPNFHVPERFGELVFDG